MIGIKEMIMPEKCIECPFYSGIMYGTCAVSAHTDYGVATMHNADIKRQQWCPLIEIDESEDGE